MCVFGRVAYPQVFVPTCLVATFSLLGRFPSGVGTVKFLNISFQSALCRFFRKTVQLRLCLPAINLNPVPVVATSTMVGITVLVFLPPDFVKRS